jgi:hypothetical protein
MQPHEENSPNGGLQFHRSAVHSVESGILVWTAVQTKTSATNWAKAPMESATACGSAASLQIAKAPNQRRSISPVGEKIGEASCYNILRSTFKDRLHGVEDRRSSHARMRRLIPA